MSRYLLIDVGAGTMDVLYFDDDSGVQYKSVARSPVLYTAESIAGIPGNLLVTGKEMGGGPVTDILKRRAREARVVMSVSAARTLSHDMGKVRSWGIVVVEDEEAEAMRNDELYHAVSIGDLDMERLKSIVAGFGVDFSFDIAGICAQDHGMPPPGVSHLDYRHSIMKLKLDECPFPHVLLHDRDEVPPTLNRLKSIADSARGIPAAEVYVMDSGMAAVLGASMDIHALGKNRILVLDIATSHTVGAALDRGEIAGVFEYHTRDISLPRLEQLLRDMADGRLDHEQILREGGHGAYLRRPFGYDSVEVIVATGPKRALVRESNLPVKYGAPLGDNMMTGTVGLLEAIRRRKGIGPTWYV